MSSIAKHLMNIAILISTLYFLFLIAIMFFAQVGYSEEQSAREFVLCKNQEEVRTLSILVNSDKSCEAHYSKLGKDEVIAQAKSPDICHDRLKQLQGILKSAKYNCRSIAKAQISSSAEASRQ